MKRSFGIILIAALFLIQCNISPTNSEDKLTDDQAASLGKVAFNLDMTDAPEAVVGLNGLLISSEQDTIFFKFEMSANTASALVENLMPGNWTLQVDAFNSDGVIIYTGSTLVSVQSGVVTPVTLRLNPTTGSLEIIVTWEYEGRYEPSFLFRKSNISVFPGCHPVVNAAHDTGVCGGLVVSS